MKMRTTVSVFVPRLLRVLELATVGSMSRVSPELTVVNVKEALRHISDGALVLTSIDFPPDAFDVFMPQGRSIGFAWRAAIPPIVAHVLGHGSVDFCPSWLGVSCMICNEDSDWVFGEIRLLNENKAEMTMYPLHYECPPVPRCSQCGLLAMSGDVAGWSTPRCQC